MSNAATFSWTYDDSTLVTYSPGNAVGLSRDVGGFKLTLTSIVPVEQYIYNFTSTLCINAYYEDVKNLNGTNITCKAILGVESVSDSVEMCFIGKKISA